MLAQLMGTPERIALARIIRGRILTAIRFLLDRQTGTLTVDSEQLLSAVAAFEDANWWMQFEHQDAGEALKTIVDTLTPCFQR
jgi:hypothetical protein